MTADHIDLDSLDDDAIRVGISEFAVTDEPIVLKSYGLGSCIGIALRDPVANVASLAHVMLPDSEQRTDTPGKYVDTALEAMLREMVDLGAGRDRIVAKIAGGSEMFEFDSFRDGVGSRNVDAVHEELESHGIRVVAEEVGGHDSRTVAFDAETGDLSIHTNDGAGGSVSEL